VRGVLSDNVGGAAPESGTAPPPACLKRTPSPDMDAAGEEEELESRCSNGDSAPSSPFVKRAESPIRSEETMPAHGEISEQESVGGNSSSMWPDQVSRFGLNCRAAFGNTTRRVFRLSLLCKTEIKHPRVPFSNAFQGGDSPHNPLDIRKELRMFLCQEMSGNFAEQGKMRGENA